MVSKFVLLSNLLLASAALAGSSSSPAGVPLAPSRETRQSYAPFYDYWPGATLYKDIDTFNTASGTFRAPTPPREDKTSINVWVGIDGATCSNRANILRAGVKTLTTNGAVTYKAWASWTVTDAYDFTDFTIRLGHTITINVLLTSSTTGTVYIKNEVTGQLVWRMFRVDSVNALCGGSAEWVVDNSEDKLATVGGVIFTRAFASGPLSGYVYSAYNPQDGALLRNMTQDGQLLMATFINSDKKSLGIIQTFALGG